MPPNSALPPHPGLAKVRVAKLAVRRRVELVTVTPGRWREVLAGADVVSEGRTETEAGARVYYGSTNVLLRAASYAGAAREDELAHLLAYDPHARLQALRIAHREAWARAESPLGSVRAEMTVAVTRRGVEIAVDVVAPLVGGALRARS